MRYIPRNVIRQNQNFVAIREAGGQEMTSDLYARDPSSSVFWFCGKVARVSGEILDSFFLVVIPRQSKSNLFC
jgi:hypothetical protein